MLERGVFSRGGRIVIRQTDPVVGLHVLAHWRLLDLWLVGHASSAHTTRGHASRCYCRWRHGHLEMFTLHSICLVVSDWGIKERCSLLRHDDIAMVSYGLGLCEIKDLCLRVGRACHVLLLEWDALHRLMHLLQLLLQLRWRTLQSGTLQSTLKRRALHRCSLQRAIMQ